MYRRIEERQLGDLRKARTATRYAPASRARSWLSVFKESPTSAESASTLHKICATADAKSALTNILSPLLTINTSTSRLLFGFSKLGEMRRRYVNLRHHRVHIFCRVAQSRAKQC